MPGHQWSPSDLYHAYQDALLEADAALAAWSDAPVDARAEAYTTYRAAADREDAAATAWLDACRSYDAAHGVAVTA
jgi:hypothetical protein